MDHSRLPQRRTLLIGLAAVGLVPLAGCMTKPMRPANADGTYCFATGKSYSRKLTCTTAPIPSKQVETAAKRFEAAPDRLTVYVVRKRWGDARNAIRLTPDMGAASVTVPESLVRLRLKPGSHTLAADWDEGRASIDIGGAAGEVVQPICHARRPDQPSRAMRSVAMAMRSAKTSTQPAKPSLKQGCACNRSKNSAAMGSAPFHAEAATSWLMLKGSVRTVSSPPAVGANDMHVMSYAGAS